MDRLVGQRQIYILKIVDTKIENLTIAIFYLLSQNLINRNIFYAKEVYI
jgi:hypothetical protein